MQPPADPDLVARLGRYLDALAARGGTVSYGRAAADLGIAPPLSIQQLTTAMAEVMAADAARGAPLRAALLVGRLGGGLPAPGFFQIARDLGCYDGPDTGHEAQAFHARQCAALARG